MIEDILELMFGDSTHLQIILLYYNNSHYFDNISGLTEKLDKSHVTVRKVVADLIKAGILKEINIGRSRVIRLNNGPYTEALFGLFDRIKEIESGKGESPIEELMRRRR